MRLGLHLSEIPLFLRVLCKLYSMLEFLEDAGCISIRNFLTFVASHLLSIQNGLAIQLGKLFTLDHEMSVNTTILRSIFQIGWILFVDLFAICQSRKSSLFCSRAGHSPEYISQAFLHPWDKILLYAYPLVLLILKVILKLKQDQGKMILIASTWTRLPWFSDLHKLSIREPLPCL